MNCINEELIQRYIDGELDAAEVFMFQNHIENCMSCQEKSNRQVKIVAEIKKTIGNLVEENIEIPEFKMNSKREPKRGIARNFFYDLSAAAVILTFVGIQVFQGENIKTEMIMMMTYQFESEYDANLPITEQEMSFEFFDENGKIIE